jgi:hypothetical protein
MCEASLRRHLHELHAPVYEEARENQALERQQKNVVCSETNARESNRAWSQSNRHGPQARGRKERSARLRTCVENLPERDHLDFPRRNHAARQRSLQRLIASRAA